MNMLWTFLLFSYVQTLKMPTVDAPSKSEERVRKVSIYKANARPISAKKGKEEHSKTSVKRTKSSRTPIKVSMLDDLA